MPYAPVIETLCDLTGSEYDVRALYLKGSDRMKGTSIGSWRKRVLRTLPVLAVGAVSFGAMLLAQKNSVQPQPQADKLAPITVPTRGQGGRGAVQKPEGVMPVVPAGFTI